MTKTEKILDIVLRYQLTNAEYEWYKNHEYIMRALAAGDLSVLQSYTYNQINAIRDIYNTWCKALELTGQLSDGLKSNRVRRGY